MPPVPKKKHTPGRGKRRRGGHKKATLPTLVKCNSCGDKKFPHKACPHCGSSK